jgi:hypothetical protein
VPKVQSVPFLLLSRRDRVTFGPSENQNRWAKDLVSRPFANLNATSFFMIEEANMSLARAHRSASNRRAPEKMAGRPAGAPPDAP